MSVIPATRRIVKLEKLFTKISGIRDVQRLSGVGIVEINEIEQYLSVSIDFKDTALVRACNQGRSRAGHFVRTILFGKEIVF